MTITHDAQEKAFENGQLVGDMRHWSMKWREADRNPMQPLSANGILPALKSILSHIQSLQVTIDHHDHMNAILAAERELRELIERIK